MRKDVPFLVLGWAVALAGLLALGGVLWALTVLAAPSALRIAGGPEDGAYATTAEAYAEQLRGQGVEVAVVNTLGASENLELLRAGKVDLAVVQSGLSGRALPPQAQARAPRHDRLVSLGGIFFEPVWVFARGERKEQDRRHLHGSRIAVGPEGSGTRALALALLRVNGVSTADVELLPLTGLAAASALLAGRIDMAVYVAARPTPAIDRLMRAPAAVSLLDFLSRADAYATLLPYLTPVRLPRGGLSLADDLPAAGVTLMAPTAFIAARDDIDPQVAALVASVMRNTHAARQMFAAEGHFPSLLNQDLPVQADARRFIERGPPLLQSWLPFRWAVLLDRLSVLALPLLTVGLPLLRFAPRAWRWRMERRIWRRYGDLLRIEGRILRDGGPTGGERQTLLKRLAALEGRLLATRTPAAFGRHLFALRRDIEFLRRRLQCEPPADEGARQVEEHARADGLGGLADAPRLAGGEAVHRQHAADRGGRGEHMPDLGPGRLAGHGPVQREGRDDAAGARAGQDGRGPPAAARRGADQPLALGAAAVAAGHGGGGAGLVQEHEAGRAHTGV